MNRADIVNIASPIRWEMIPNLYEPTKYINTLSVPNMPFYDNDLYFDHDTDSLGRKQYKTFFRNK
jgi:hypothetical protein